MKKKFAIVVFCFVAFVGKTQKTLLNVVEDFYPANPFNYKFSVFLEKILTSKFITDRVIDKRTDSSLYFFKGEFKEQNPFLFRPLRTDVILAEKEIQYADTANSKDTIFLYQVVGYSNERCETVEYEFTRFQKEYGKLFDNSTHSDILNAGKVEGGTYNYFLNATPLSPLSVSWGRMNKTEFAIVVTLRFLVSQNEAMLPTYEPN